jgi:hypothetical protein
LRVWRRRFPRSKIHSKAAGEMTGRVDNKIFPPFNAESKRDDEKVVSLEGGLRKGPCRHERVRRVVDQWFCNECEREFVPKYAGRKKS